MKSHPLLFRTAVSSLLTTALVLTLGGPASAQLADGPWSMYRHDVCHTGQSPNLGPLFAGTPGVPGTPGATDVKIWHGFDKLRTSPSLSADGKTVFFGMGFDFCAVDTASMTTYDCLVIPADVSDSSPAVGLDGTIYMGDRDNSLNAYTLTRVANPLSLDLTLKWRYNHGHEGDIWQHPVIAPASVPEAGTIYFSHDQSTDGAGIFTALLDNGTPFVKWKFKIGNFVRQSSPAIDANGIIYFGDLNGYVYAFADKGACTDNGTLRTQPALTSSCTPNSTGGPVLLWRKQVGTTPGLTASPVISADSNTLYIGTMGAVAGIPMGLTALDISCSAAPCPPPAVKWTFATTGKVDQTPALGRDGTLYVPSLNGGQKMLQAIKPNASGPPTLKWTFGPFASGSETSAYPIVGGDGTVYVGLGNTVYALDPLSGATLWSYAATNFIQSSPLIGPVTGGRAVLYVPSRDHNLYAISNLSQNTTTATTCWTDGAPIGNRPPVANAGPDQSVTASPAGTAAVTFQGSATDPDNDSPLTFAWSFGDNSPAGSGPSPTHTYASPGVYTATLTVNDGHGGIDSDTVTITVNPSGGGGGGTFSDEFTRADSDSLTGPSPSGPQWAEPVVNGQYTGNLAIAGNKLINTARGDNIAYLPTLPGATTSGANQSASGDFISSDNNSSPRLGVLLRYQDARNHYRLYRISGGSSQLRISKIVNGAETILKSVQVPMATLNTPFHLVGSIVGKTLTLTLPGVPALSFTEATTTYATGTIGVLVNTGPAATHAADHFCAAIGTATCN